MLVFRPRAWWRSDCSRHRGKQGMILVARSSSRLYWIGKTSEYNSSHNFSCYLFASVSYQGRITNQMRRLGGSFDWNRVAFTMNPVRSIDIAFILCLQNIRCSQKLSLRLSADCTKMALFTELIAWSIGACASTQPSPI